MVRKTCRFLLCIFFISTLIFLHEISSGSITAAAAGGGFGNGTKLYTVTIKNKLPWLLRVHCDGDFDFHTHSSSTTPADMRIVKFNEELIKHFHVDPYLRKPHTYCSFITGKKRQFFRVAGRETVCPDPTERCRFEVREDGFYLVEGTDSKFVFPWKKHGENSLK